ncbi:MAG: hypothetical protein FJ225_13380 [Lentisphaerae bacterium]|nr:hypothetical protein [Lentisphaerota bacterium]
MVIRGRPYNFFRGLDGDLKPAYAWSDDGGLTWHTGNRIIPSPSLRPYVKYASNGTNTIHLIYTEGHPGEFGKTSVFHVYYRNGRLHRSDGSVIATLAQGLPEVAAGTPIFNGDTENLAWVSDLHLDAAGRPYAAYSVHRKNIGIPPGADHRYRYARWTGERWLDYEIAYAGSRLCPGQDDYTGNIALDPHDPGIAFISTNADPVSGAPLVSAADGQRHWEIYRGVTPDGGESWCWSAWTAHSTVDNLRPIVPGGDSRHRAVLWLRGRYRDYTDYELEIVGVIMRKTSLSVRGPRGMRHRQAVAP